MLVGPVTVVCKLARVVASLNLKALYLPTCQGRYLVGICVTLLTAAPSDGLETSWYISLVA